MASRIKVTHVITGLDVGGAETMLCRFLETYDRDAFECDVVSMRPFGPLGQRVLDSDTRLTCLDMDRPTQAILGIPRMVRFLRETEPDLIQTWMYHSDFLGSLAAKLSGLNTPVVWGIHQSQLCPATSKRITRLLNSFLSGRSYTWPAQIISCSHTAMELHAQSGYDSERMRWISNGTDTTFYRPNTEAALNTRQQLGIPPDALVIGTAGRFNPQKDYPNFFAAIRVLQQSMPEVHFVACGHGVDESSSELAYERQTCLHPDRVHLLGVRRDMEAVYPAWDICTLPSAYGEACPLTLAEAMSCQIPSIATDVGDSGQIIGDTGTIVPPRSPEALAGAWKSMLDLSDKDRQELGQRARRRIVDCFSLSSCVGQYEDVYRDVLNQPAPLLQAA